MAGDKLGGHPGMPVGLLGALGALGVGELLPDSLAAWRPLLIDGLAFFLGRLPAARRAAIVAEQLALPVGTSPPRRLTALLSRSPTLHKAGQVVARQRALDPALRHQLQALESMPPSVSMAAVTAAIRQELGGDPPLQLAPAALAEGSVAVVVPFSYRAAGGCRHGVFKLLKPGIEAQLADELGILPDLAGFLAERGRALGLPPVDYQDLLASVGRLLQHEVRSENEQENLRAAAAFYAGDARILVPQLLPWCTPRLTAMERVFGGKLADADLPAGERGRLADLLISGLVGRPFWNPSAQAVFHADLHAGNLLLSDDRRLAIVDWSLTASLSKSQREMLLAAALAGMTLDAPAVRRAVAGLTGIAADHPGLAAAVEHALDRVVFAGCLPGFDWLLGLLDDVALHTGAGFGDDFARFRKTWVSLSGVLGELVAHPAPDRPLLSLGVERFVAELPARWLASTETRCFSTHVSNADLVRLGASAGLAAMRYWTRCCDRQLLRAASVR